MKKFTITISIPDDQDLDDEEDIIGSVKNYLKMYFPEAFLETDVPMPVETGSKK